MKLFTTNQIRNIDAYTIEHEPISSILLIERVANALCNSFTKHFDKSNKIAVLAGKGNNGSDAIALAILLEEQNYDVTIFHFNPEVCRIETQTFIKRIKGKTIDLFCSEDSSNFDIIIDGLLGTGLSKPVEGIEKKIIETINNAKAKVVSIDIPSGLLGDSISDKSQTIVKADYTFTLEFPKLSFMFPENGSYIGELEIIPIGLHKTIIEQIETPYSLTQKEQVLIKRRERFAHKGNYGHVLTIAGSLGKMGAAILTTKACLRIGAGLITAHIPKCGISILQTANPEVMANLDKEEKFISEIPFIEKTSTISIGPGIGTELETQKAVISLLSTTKTPLVIDADGLNCIALQNATHIIPKDSILTPHVKEFERLFGTATNSQNRLEMQIEQSKKLQVYIVLKGFRTSITTPDGLVYFNSTGNPGMATAGSGDVLTGIISGLLAQGYTPKDAAIFGVFIHGLAGDIAAKELNENCLIASDIIQFIPQAIHSLKTN